MAEDETEAHGAAAEPGRKPGFFGRLFGRGGNNTPPAPPPAEPAESAPLPPDQVESAPPPAEPLESAPPPAESAASAPPLDEPAESVPPTEPAESALAPAEPASPAEPVVGAPPLAEPLAEKRSWWQRLRSGLARSSNSLGKGITNVFTKRKLDAAMLDELEDVLIQADLGVATAERIREAVGKGRYDRAIEPGEVKAILAREVEKVLEPVAMPLDIEAGGKPFVILVVGVNGSGKTTTIGKLAAKFASEGRKVVLAAGDTFRAAAIEQLQIWGERIGAPVIARPQGSDAAGLAFDAISQAKADGADVLLMDTAGRLQNRAELMAELEKILRVMKKVDAAAPHAVLLVLDATIGQNAVSQVEIFGRKAGVTGLVMTKLDGTARGGILVAVAERFKLPVHFIGVGEGQGDLEPFAAADFARAIAGLDE